MPCCALPWLHVDVIWVSKWFQSHTIWCGKLMLIGDSRMSQNRSACLNDFKYVYFFFKPLKSLNLRPWSRRNLKSSLLWCPNSEPCWFTSSFWLLNEAQWGSMRLNVPHISILYIYLHCIPMLFGWLWHAGFARSAFWLVETRYQQSKIYLEASTQCLKSSSAIPWCTITSHFTSYNHPIKYDNLIYNYNIYIYI